MGLQLDCPNPIWDRHWINHWKEFRKFRLATEFITEKLYQHIHTRALSSTERGKVETVAIELETTLVGSRHSKVKSDILQGIRSITLDAKNEE